MGTEGNGSNGETGLVDGDVAELPPAPAEVQELAEACVAYVERSLKIRLDFTPETLPLLDHWMRDRRKDVGVSKDDIMALVAAPAGAYLGEVARRVLRLRWFAPPGDYRRWRIELENVFLSMNPIGAAVEALLMQEAENWGASFRMRPEDKEHAKAVLANLGEVELEEYYAPSNRLEMLHIIADALMRKEYGEDEPIAKYGADDYGPLRAEAIGAIEEEGEN